MANILLIDDDHNFRSMLCELLSRKGYNVIEAQDGREGANLAASEKAWPAAIGHLKKYLE